jgi:hypothetical protein
MGRSLQNSRERSSHLEKEHVVYNGGFIPTYRYLDKEIPLQGESPHPSILSLLPSVTKTKGKVEKVFWVVVTLLRRPQPLAILLALKPKYL